jgi:hypothetical protein
MSRTLVRQPKHIRHPLPEVFPLRFLNAILVIIFLCGILSAQEFSCPAGQADVMKYFALSQNLRATQNLKGTANPIYTRVFPDQDFAETGYWFWLKSQKGNGFDVKSFDANYVYMRSTELVWTDNSTFKRFIHDLPIAPRCVEEGKPGQEIQVKDTAFRYYSSCNPYKQSQLGTAVTNLDAPVRMDTEGRVGKVWTRVLHYQYNCNKDFEQCADEEQFFLGNGYGLWQWRHYKNGTLVKKILINNIEGGSTNATLPCANSYEP